MTAHEATPSDAAIATVVRDAYASDLQFAGKARPELQRIMDLSRRVTAREIEQGRGSMPELPTIGDLIARQKVADPEFSDWVTTVPDKHWATKDLAALRIGYELGKSYRRRENQPNLPKSFARVCDDGCWLVRIGETDSFDYNESLPRVGQDVYNEQQLIAYGEACRRMGNRDE